MSEQMAKLDGSPLTRTDLFWRADLESILRGITLAAARPARAMPGLRGIGYREGFADAIIAMALAVGVPAAVPWPVQGELQDGRNHQP